MATLPRHYDTLFPPSKTYFLLVLRHTIPNGATWLFPHLGKHDYDMVGEVSQSEAQCGRLNRIPLAGLLAICVDTTSPLSEVRTEAERNVAC